MPNQYIGSFEHVVNERFGCSAKSLLEGYVDEGLSYIDASKRLGFQHVTIRKWARRFGLQLKVVRPVKDSKKEKFLEKFKERGLNQCNVLSRQWLVL